MGKCRNNNTSHLRDTELKSTLDRSSIHEAPRRKRFLLFQDGRRRAINRVDTVEGAHNALLLCDVAQDAGI